MPSSRREALALAHELAVWLAANVAEQVRALAERGLDALLLVDEPALHVFGTEDVERAWDPLRAVAPAWGLHLCGPVPWDVVERAEPDVLSFDLALPPRGAGDGDAAPPARPRRPDRLGRRPAAPRRARAARARRACSTRSSAPARAGEQSLLTASCGSGRMSVRRENELAAVLWSTARANSRTSGTAR